MNEQNCKWVEKLISGINFIELNQWFSNLSCKHPCPAHFLCLPRVLHLIQRISGNWKTWSGCVRCAVLGGTSWRGLRTTALIQCAAQTWGICLVLKTKLFKSFFSKQCIIGCRLNMTILHWCAHVSMQRKLTKAASIWTNLWIVPSYQIHIARWHRAATALPC